MEIFDIFLAFLLLYGTYLVLPVVLLVVLGGLVFGVVFLFMWLEDLYKRGK